MNNEINRLASELAALNPGFSVAIGKLQNDWSGLAILANLANLLAKDGLPGSKKVGYALKKCIVEEAVRVQVPGLGYDDSDAKSPAYRWTLADLETQPQLSFHSLSTRGSEYLPKVSWAGKKWQDHEGFFKLMALYLNK